jgi:hypothetical protein
VTEDEAKVFIKGFEEKFSVLAAWLERHGELAKFQNYSRIVNGAMRFMGGEGANDAAKTRMGKNNQIQAMGSWQTRMAMISLDRQIQTERLPIRMIGQIHDELLSMFRYWDGCPSALFYLNQDIPASELKVALAVAKSEKDKTAEKQIEKALEDRKAAVHHACGVDCIGKDCAHRYETIIGNHMEKACVDVLKGIVPGGFSLATARCWSH